MIEENDSEDDFLPMKTSSKKNNLKKNKIKKDLKENPLQRKKSSKKRTPKKKSSKKRTLRQQSPSTSSPISPQNTSHMDPSMRANLAPISSPRIVGVPVVDCSRQNTSYHFGIVESHPRVDERFITMRKKQSSVSEHPRFPMSRKALLIKRLYDLKKTNRRFMDKKMHFQPPGHSHHGRQI